MGTPAPAAHILARLVQSSGSAGAEARPAVRVVAVVTRPDQPRGRGLALGQSEVASTAARFAIPTLKPAKIKTAEFAAELKSFAPDLIVVAAYGRILPKAILEVPRLMPINVHLSLLPHHRGAAPVEGAILAGDSQTGATIMRMTEQMDAGPILMQRTIPIATDDTQGSLKTKLAEVGASLLLEALAAAARGQLTETAQDESAATYTSPVKKDDAAIDWHADAVHIERMTRAYDPWPVARTTLDGEPLMVFRAAVHHSDASQRAPGTIVALKPVPVVQCGGGALALIEVQAPGRKRMAGADFFRGRRVEVGQRLGA
jgi:methionyl-tRNA formyltransferase